MDTTELAQLKAALRDGPVTINFTKVNGSRRTLVGTLQGGVIPPVQGTPNKDPNILTVYDIQHNGWRTMKVESIHDWNPGEQVEEPSAPTPPTVGWTPNTPAPTGK